MSTRDDLAELLAEWRTTCRLTGLPYTDADAAAFVAEAYPFNRLYDLAAAESRVADLEAGIRRLCDEAKSMTQEGHFGATVQRAVPVTTLRALLGKTRSEATR